VWFPEVVVDGKGIVSRRIRLGSESRMQGKGSNVLFFPVLILSTDCLCDKQGTIFVSALQDGRGGNKRTKMRGKKTEMENLTGLTQLQARACEEMCHQHSDQGNSHSPVPIFLLDYSLSTMVDRIDEQPQ